MSASWYDVLGVDPGASDEEIRAAWRASIDDLDPTDRRFALYNEAAGVLLDRDRRTAYDAERAQASGAAGTPESPADLPERPADPEPVLTTSLTTTELTRTRWWWRNRGKAGGGAAADEQATEADEPTVGDPGRRRRVPGWLLAGLGLATVAVAVAALLVTLLAPAAVPLVGDDGADSEQALSQAQEAARKSVPQVFTYDYRYPERDFDRALQVLTGELKDDYEEVWDEAIAPNLTKVKGTAKSEVVGTGAVRASDDGDRAEVLVIVNSTTGNVKGSQQLTLALTVTMVREDGEWLIAEMEGFDPDEVTEEPPPSATPGPSDSPAPSGSPAP